GHQLMRESFNKVLGYQCNHLDIEVTFTSTFKTITRVTKAHNENKMPSYALEKNILIFDGHVLGLDTVRYVNDTSVTYADGLEKLREKSREKTNYKWLIEQTSGSLGMCTGRERTTNAKRYEPSCKRKWESGTADKQKVCKLFDKIPQWNDTRFWLLEENVEA
ncbi:hypothetical protein KI387_000682, partial [Taxus chinensis]